MQEWREGRDYRTQLASPPGGQRPSPQERTAQNKGLIVISRIRRMALAWLLQFGGVCVQRGHIMSRNQLPEGARAVEWPRAGDGSHYSPFTKLHHIGRAHRVDDCLQPFRRLAMACCVQHKSGQSQCSSVKMAGNPTCHPVCAFCSSFPFRYPCRHTYLTLFL